MIFRLIFPTAKDHLHSAPGLYTILQILSHTLTPDCVMLSREGQEVSVGTQMYKIWAFSLYSDTWLLGNSKENTKSIQVYFFLQKMEPIIPPSSFIMRIKYNKFGGKKEIFYLLGVH